MTIPAPRRLLHLLISIDSGKALPLVLAQQRAGNRPTVVLGPVVADLTIPAGLRVKVLGGEFDDRALLKLIDESDSVSVW